MYCVKGEGDDAEMVEVGYAGDAGDELEDYQQSGDEEESDLEQDVANEDYAVEGLDDFDVTLLSFFFWENISGKCNKVSVIDFAICPSSTVPQRCCHLKQDTSRNQNVFSALGERRKLPCGVWGGASVENKFGTILASQNTFVGIFLAFFGRGV